MRILPQELLDAQRMPAIRPAVMVSVADVAFRSGGPSTGNTTTCQNTRADTLSWTRDEGGRILKIKTLESPYKSNATITLNNYDRLLYDIKMYGNRLYISWGAETRVGPIYSTMAPLWVKQQTFFEQEGAMQCVLDCVGVPTLLDSDGATEEYIDDGTTPVGELIIKILESELECYKSCRQYNVVLDDKLDNLWTGVYLGDSFVIKKGMTRTNVLAILFDMTHASFKVGGEIAGEDDKDTIHIFTISDELKAEFTLDRSGHRFYVAADSRGIVTPSEIIIRTPPDASPQYIGSARDPYSYNMNPSTRVEYVSGLDSDYMADKIANIMMANVVAAVNGSSAVLPMHCGLEVFDRVKIVSKRSNQEFIGSVGVVQRLFSPTEKEPKYEMTVSFGKWFDPRSSDDTLGYGYGYLGTEIKDDSATWMPGGGHISIPQLYPTKTTGTWGWYALALGVYMTYGVYDQSSITYKAYLTPGNYTLIWETMCIPDVSPICDVYIDDNKIYTIDLNYQPQSLIESLSTTFSIYSSGAYEITFKTNGKTATEEWYTHVVMNPRISGSSYVGSKLPILTEGM